MLRTYIYIYVYLYKFRVVSICRGRREDVKGFNSLLVYSVLINFRHSFIFIENKPADERSLTRVWSRARRITARHRSPYNRTICVYRADYNIIYVKRTGIFRSRQIIAPEVFRIIFRCIVCSVCAAVEVTIRVR